jgi:3-methyladenine DNA glycosylase AlkD
MEAEMDFDTAVAELEAARSEQIATIYSRRNPGAETWGVRFGDMEKLVKKIKKDSELALQLWAIGVVEPRIVACRIMRPEDLTEAEIDAWVKQVEWPSLADEFANLVYRTPFRDRKREEWTKSDDEFVRRAGFTLLYNTAADPKSGISDDELRGYLDQIEREIHDSPNWAREMMNMVPIAIGLRNETLKEDAVRTAMAYGKVDVFHGDKTNCKVWDAVDALNNPKTKVKPPA